MGTAHIREITREDWLSVGVDHDTVKWYHGNAFMIPASRFSDEAWPYIVADELLILVGGEDDGEAPKALPAPPNVDELRAANLVDVSEAPSGVTATGSTSGGTGGPVGGSTASTGTGGGSTGGSVGGSTANTGT